VVVTTYNYDMTWIRRPFDCDYNNCRDNAQPPKYNDVITKSQDDFLGQSRAFEFAVSKNCVELN